MTKAEEREWEENSGYAILYEVGNPYEAQVIHKTTGYAAGTIKKTYFRGAWLYVAQTFNFQEESKSFRKLLSAAKWLEEKARRAQERNLPSR